MVGVEPRLLEVETAESLRFREEVLDFGLNGLGKDAFVRDDGSGQSAGCCLPVVQGDAVSPFEELGGAGQSGGTCSNHGHVAPRGFVRQLESLQSALAGLFRDRSLDSGNADGLQVQQVFHAGTLAKNFHRTNQGADLGQRISIHQDFVGAFQVASTVRLDEPRDVQVHRACLLAHGEGAVPAAVRLAEKHIRCNPTVATVLRAVDLVVADDAASLPAVPHDLRAGGARHARLAGLQLALLDQVLDRIGVSERAPALTHKRGKTALHDSRRHQRKVVAQPGVARADHGQIRKRPLNLANQVNQAGYAFQGVLLRRVEAHDRLVVRAADVRVEVRVSH